MPGVLLTEEQKRQIIFLYNDDWKSTTEIAKIVGCSANTACRVLNGAGVDTSSFPCKNKLDYVVKLQKEGKTNVEIAAELGGCARQVTTWLRKRGIQIRPQIDRNLKDEAVRLYSEDKMSIRNVANRLGIGSVVVRRAVINAGAIRTLSKARCLATRKDMGRDQYRSQAYHWQSRKTGIWQPAGSRWELVRMSQLDDDNSVAEWTRCPFYISYNGGKTYNPDLLVTYKDGRKVVEEIKPQRYAITPKNQAKFAAARVYLQEKNIPFVVMTEEEIGREAIRNFKIEGLAQMTVEAGRLRRKAITDAYVKANRDKINARKRNRNRLHADDIAAKT